jgi:two-component system, OmpR family, sensor histidine kinase VanS
MDMVGQLADESIFIIRSPYGSIYDTVNSTNKFLICGGGVTVLCGLLFVWFFSQKITKPIMELAELSQRMANLDFDAKYTSGGENEIGILGGNFNLMSKRLEETITELKRANNQLQKDIEQKEKIEDMRNEFLGNVSHELKTPIALIQGYAEGLRDGITEEPESMEFYCDVIIDEANKMNQMVKNLLTLNQLEFGDEDLEITRFNLVGLIRGVLASCEILLQQAEAEVDCVTEEEVYVWADEFKTEQVFRNYLTNAIHHVDNEKRIEIRIIPQGDTVKVTVFNSGKPIPEEDIAKLWDKFYKVDKAHTREYGGNGIGLSIVKAIMESFHQQYGVKNYDNGVEFWFELDSKTSKCDSKVQVEET